MIGDILQPTHLLFVLVVALLVLGPKRLPEAGRALGRGIRDFRMAIGGDEDHSSALSSQPTPAPPPEAVVPPATAPPVETPPSPSHTTASHTTASDTTASDTTASDTTATPESAETQQAETVHPV